VNRLRAKLCGEALQFIKGSATYPEKYDELTAAPVEVKCKAIPVTGRGGPWGYETSRLPHFLNNRLTDGGEVSLTRRKTAGTHLLEAAPVKRFSDKLPAGYHIITNSSDGQLAARGLIYSGSRQVTGLFSQNLNFTTVMA
jgi:hypothetical protein